MTALSVIVPTFNEREAVPLVIAALDAALTGIDWEVIFVDDDSPDGTAAAAREIARTRNDVRVLQRVGQRGLSGACIAGMLASAAPCIAVIDADLQHDETLLPEMLRRLNDGNLDVVVGTRYAEGGSTGDGLDERRGQISRAATRLSRLVLRAEVSDPMSGFFILRRSFLERVLHRLSGKGFKILLDLFTSSREPVRFAEMPYTMRPRIAGESKLDTMAVWEYLLLVLDKLVGRFIPVRFLMFAAIGTLGAVVHLSVLYLFLLRINVDFVAAQAIATYFAMTLNYLVNNLFTYRDMQLKGAALFKGLATFYAACTVGAIINVGLGEFLYEHAVPWWLAGTLGAGVGAVWNFGVTSVFTWRVGRPN
jgi:dolichol-phosphate mannosyltransferase